MGYNAAKELMKNLGLHDIETEPVEHDFGRMNEK